MTADNRWTFIHPSALDAAWRCAKGEYQAAILRGDEAISGSTLKGRGRKYGAQYKRSRDALLVRLRSAGLSVQITTTEDGRKILIIGEETT